MSDGSSENDPGGFPFTKGKAGGSESDSNRICADRPGCDDFDTFARDKAKFTQARTDRISRSPLFNPINNGVIPLGERIQIPHQLHIPVRTSALQERLTAL